MTTPSTDPETLIGRLRQYEGKDWETTFCYNGLRDEAANEIERLSSANARLAGVIDRLTSELERLRNTPERLTNRMDATFKEIPMTTNKPWAIYTDYSGVVNLGNNNGGFETEMEAVENLVNRLESELEGTRDKLARARRRRSYLRLRRNQP